MTTISSPKPFAIPPTLVEDLKVVAVQLRNGDAPGPALSRALAKIAELPPATVLSARRDIAYAADLSSWQEPKLWPWIKRRTASHAELLQLHPQLAWLFVFHLSGYLREAAMHKISGPIDSPFLFAEILTRLNDWVYPVRVAAEQCAERTFPATNAAIVAKSSFALFLPSRNWSRWQEGRQILDATQSRQDVCAEMAARLITAEGNRASRIAREMLQHPHMDEHLEHLATKAKLPSVRSVAVDVLLRRRASWQTGWDWQWIDKSMGIRRRVPSYTNRTIGIAVDQNKAMRAALEDRSATVRAGALSALIAHEEDFPDAVPLAERLASDKSRKVRERAHFLLTRAAARRS